VSAEEIAEAIDDMGFESSLLNVKDYSRKPSKSKSLKALQSISISKEQLIDT
jgi:hypothetical protein